MANIQARTNKEGRVISYCIRVYRGRDPKTGKQLTPYTCTWRVPDGWGERRARKEAEKQAVLFERRCRQGISNGTQTFAEYAEYVLSCKITMGMKHLTEIHYRQSLQRVMPILGPMKLCDIKPQHLNLLYQSLSSPQARNDNEMEQDKPILWKTLEKQGIFGDLPVKGGGRIPASGWTSCKACHRPTYCRKFRYASQRSVYPSAQGKNPKLPHCDELSSAGLRCAGPGRKRDVNSL